MSDCLYLKDAFDKLSAHLRHSYAEVGCPRLDEAEAEEDGNEN